MSVIGSIVSGFGRVGDGAAGGADVAAVVARTEPCGTPAPACLGVAPIEFADRNGSIVGFASPENNASNLEMHQIKGRVRLVELQRCSGVENYARP